MMGGNYALPGAVEEVKWQMRTPTGAENVPMAREGQMDEQMLEQVEGIDVMIADETRRILVEWIGVDPSTNQEQIDQEALRLQGLTEDAAEAYEQQNPAPQAAFYSEVVQAKETAWRTARELVLTNELYPQVTPEMIAEREALDSVLDKMTEERWDRARETKDPDRWRTQNVRPSRAATRVVERVWLAKPGWFRSLAKALIAQRIEDRQPVPMTSRDPLVDELTELIEDEMRRNPPADPELPF